MARRNHATAPSDSLTGSQLARASIDDCMRELRRKQEELTKAIAVVMQLETEVGELAIRVREAALREKQ